MTIFRLRFLLLILLFVVLPVKNGLTEEVYPEKATTVAKNWLSEYVRSFGSWAGSKNPEIVSSDVITSEGEVTGYNFTVSPAGHIIVQARDELFPVKLYSETGRLDFSSTVNQNDEVRTWLTEELSGHVRSLRKASRSISLRSSPQKELWDYLSQVSFEKRAKRDDLTVNIGPLLTTQWHQDDPYNSQCPTDDVNKCQTIVGCVATATAQILRYWKYPSNKWAWDNMPDQVYSFPFSSQAQIDAVSQLCSDVGVSVGMSYGCKESSACLKSTVSLFQSLGYPNAAYYTRYNLKCGFQISYSDCYTPICILIHSTYTYSAADWLNGFFKPEITANRPVLFAIKGIDTTNGNTASHAVVADGYQVFTGGTYIHINFGWGNSNPGNNDPTKAWYTPDDITGNVYDFNTIGAQAVVIGIAPACDFALSQSSQTFPTTASGSGSISITTATSDKCQWSSSTNDSWITLSQTTGNNNGTLSYSVAYNSTGVQRTGTISISGKNFTVTQGAVPIGAVLAAINSILLEDEIIKGDINGDNSVNLADAILALRIVAGISVSGTINLNAEVNSDKKIGIDEVIYILQVVSGLRN